MDGHAWWWPWGDLGGIFPGTSSADGRSPAGCGDSPSYAITQGRSSAMSVARVTVINAATTKSFEDATRIGIERANKTLQNVKGAWIQEQKLRIEGGKITEYRVNMKITFILKD